MKLSEFLSKLLNIAHDLDPEYDLGGELAVDPEVHLVTQPNWPLVNHVCGVKIVCNTDDEIEELEGAINSGEVPDDRLAELKAELEQLKNSRSHIVYISEGSHIGYGSSDMWPDE